MDTAGESGVEVHETMDEVHLLIKTISKRRPVYAILSSKY